MKLLILCSIPLVALAQTPTGANATPSPVQSILPWAYPVAAPGTPATPPAQDDGKPKRVPGSDVALTLPQIRDLFNPPDWYPGDHPAMPETVGHGRRPD